MSRCDSLFLKPRDTRGIRNRLEHCERGGSSQGEFVMNRRTFLKGAAAIGLGATTFQPASAQSFPTNVIRIVVPNSASTPPDILARIVATANDVGWEGLRRRRLKRR